MKTAICFTGTGRSLEYTSDNIRKLLIEPHPGCDVFAHIAETKHAQQLERYFNFPQIKNMVVEKDEVVNLNGLRWQPQWPMGIYSGDNAKQTYMNMLLSRKKCGVLLSKYSEENDIVYDKVIFSRLDIEYFHPLPTVMDLNYLCVPDFHHFDTVQGAGCNDRFAASNFKNMKIYFQLYDNIRDMVRSGTLLHGESTLRMYLKLRGVPIKKYPIRFTRVRPNGFKQDERLQNKTLDPRDY